MKWIKRIVIGILIYAAIVALLFSIDIFWISPPHYKVDKQIELEVPVMSMADYEAIIQTHRRPYTFSLMALNGSKATVVGVEHINDPGASSMDTVRTLWQDTDPDVALVEGKMGFLFTWIQNPISTYGESGLTASLAKKSGTSLYTWEPSKKDEVALLLKKFPADHLAVFYTLRPYLAKVRNGEIDQPNSQVLKYIDSRTNVDGLRGVIKRPEDIDKIWNKAYPQLNWRTYVDPQNMYPPGFMFDVFNASNLARDEHMIRIILSCLEEKKNVFITMGSSHAPRIEKTLRHHVVKID